MKLLRIKAVAKKELIQIRRDPLSLAMAFLLPALLLFIFGYAITLDVNNIKTVIYDQDRSSLSRELIRELTASGYFSITGFLRDGGDMAYYLDSGKARIAVNIPPDFSKKIMSRRGAELQVIVDGSDSNTATIAIGYVAGLIELYTRRIGGTFANELIEPRIRLWYNPELKSRNFIIPGLIAVIMAIISALLTSLTFAREWERGTMEQLIAAPIRPAEMVLGKLLPYFVIGFADVAMASAMAVLLFGVPMKGGLAFLALFSGIFLFGGLGLGMLVSIITKAQLVASQISMVATFLPAFLLSGFMFSILNMPRPLQVMTHILPARYFVAGLKAVFLKGSGFSLLVFETSVLALFGAVIFILCVKKFKKRIE